MAFRMIFLIIALIGLIFLLQIKAGVWAFIVFLVLVIAFVAFFKMD